MYNLYYTDNIHSGFSVDCVILGFYKGKLRILLNKFDVMGKWMLPGGFMLKSENSDQATFRILKTRTGLENIYIRQFHLFSDVNRVDIDENRKLANRLWPESGHNNWMLQRFVTLGYLALVKYQEVFIPKLVGEQLQWHEVNKLPALYIDHQNIIQTALEYIRSVIPIFPVAYSLLPEQFVMTDLRKIFETFLNTTFDRRNFQRKILAEQYVIPVEKTDGEEPKNTYNAPTLYTFNTNKADIFARKPF